MAYAVSIRDSLNRILETRLGSRVMRPDFGSRLNELVDRRVDDEWRLDAARFTLEAVSRWEPRIELLSVRGGMTDDSRVSLSLRYRVKATDEVVDTEVAA